MEFNECNCYNLSSYNKPLIYFLLENKNTLSDVPEKVF